MSGALTSVDLVNFYAARCYTIGRQLELTTEELFDEALIMAKHCDEERALAIANKTQDNLPFLHGIPISVKELYFMKGKLSTVGLAMNNQRSKIDGVAVQPLLEAGAIPLIRGNVSQAALSIHSTNHIWGTC